MPPEPLPTPLGRVAGVAILLLLALAWLPEAARAHAAFQEASPEPGARLEVGPGEITLAFTEPLNRRLTRAKLVDVRSGRRIPADVRVDERKRLVLRARQTLPTAPYRVDWRTVSTLDGHALEGSFGFGVRTNAVGGARQLEQSPLARNGWLRIALRSVFYIALFFFGGGLLAALLLAGRGPPTGWLLADGGRAAVIPAGRTHAARIWRRTRAAGWVAAAAGVGVALAETADAAGSLSWRSLNDYLLSTQSGAARALAVVAVGLAAALAGRAWRAASLALLASLLAVALSGHANSASPRVLAVSTDWLHLAAGTTWVGGIAQIAATWLPGIRRLTPIERRVVMRTVLDRFGRLALPAFAVVVLSGSANALIELGRLSELWSTDYGRVLAVKVALVAAIGAASYAHAMRLRPRVLADAAPSDGAERRHWRLLGGEPVLAAGVLVAAALLAMFPLPPRQLLERAAAGDEVVPVSWLRPPRDGELAVAEHAGPWIVAVWIRQHGNATTGTVRLINYDLRPVAAAIGVHGADVRRCGRGCAVFTSDSTPASLRVMARRGATTHAAAVPIRWHPARGAVARRVLQAALGAMSRLRSLRIEESLTSGLGNGTATTRYRIQGRHRYATVTRSKDTTRSITIGRKSWHRTRPGGQWMRYTDAEAADTRLLEPWWTHRTGIRLLTVRSVRGHKVAELALADLRRPEHGDVPFWFRLRVDLATGRVLRMRMIAPGHFMNHRYHAFNSPIRIRPPARES